MINFFRKGFYFNRTCREYDTRQNFTIIDNRVDERKLEEKKKMFALELKSNLSRKMDKYMKFKNKISKLIPLNYDVVIRPKIISNEFTISDVKSKNLISDMKINLAIRLLCNYSTSFILVNTKEFSNIDLR